MASFLDVVLTTNSFLPANMAVSDFPQPWICAGMQIEHKLKKTEL